MKGMSVIVGDVAEYVTKERLAVAYQIDPLDLADAILEKLYEEGVTDALTLKKWSSEWLGRTGLWKVLEYLHLKFDYNEKPDILLEKWFAYRGVGEHLQPQVRPDELTKIIAEQAQQIAAAPTKMDGLRTTETWLTSLLRYVSLFYWRELRQSGLLGEGVDADGSGPEVIRMLEELSLSELCKLLNCDVPLKARPYKLGSEQKVILSSGAAGTALSRLTGLTGAAAAWSPRQNQEFADCLTALLDEWHGDDPYTPKGCAVAEILETGFTRQVTCHDELGGTVILNGVASSLAYGDDVLVRAGDEGKVLASKPQAVPKGGAWEMPETGSPEGRSERTVKRRVRDQVFISYSHQDGEWLKKLKTHLAPYIKRALLVVWDDSEIRAGAVWKEEIRQALASARVAVLLVSPAFLESEFIAEQELPPLLDAAKSEGVTILWVPVESSSFEVTPIAEYHAVHPPQKPLESLSSADRNEALKKICKVIHQEYQR